MGVRSPARLRARDLSLRLGVQAPAATRLRPETCRSAWGPRPPPPPGARCLSPPPGGTICRPAWGHDACPRPAEGPG
ncbi:unnamed protein product, partial [Staurois parvus]